MCHAAVLDPARGHLCEDSQGGPVALVMAPSQTYRWLHHSHIHSSLMDLDVAPSEPYAQFPHGPRHGAFTDLHVAPVET